MKQLIARVLENPSLLDEISSEQMIDPMDIAALKAMETVRQKGLNLSLTTLEDLLSEVDGGSSVMEYIIEVSREEYERQYDGDYLVAIARERWNKHVLKEASKFLDYGIDNEMTSEEILSSLNNEILPKISTPGKLIATRDAVEHAFQQIDDIYMGRRPPYWRTGDKKFDEIVSFSPNKIIVIAAAKKIGKTLFTIDRVMRLLDPDNGNSLRVLWFSFEMRPEEIIMNQIAWLTGIDTRLLRGKSEEKMTQDQMLIVKSTKEMIRDLPITYVSQRRNIDGIERDVAKYVNGDTLVVIDNLGLIELMGGMTDVQEEDLISKRLVQIRDRYGPCIIPIHHLTKANEADSNRDNLYRPTVAHVRGSSRIVDYANALLLLHRPGHYRQLQNIMSEDAWESIKDKFTVDVPIIRDGDPGEINFEHQIWCSTFKELE